LEGRGWTPEPFSQSESVTLRLAVCRQSVHLGDKPLETGDQQFFHLNIFGHRPCVISSLTRRLVCHLQLLLVLASEVILVSESHGTHDYILLSQIRDSPNLEGQIPVFISPRMNVVQLFPQALGSLFVATHDSQGYPAFTWAVEKRREEKCPSPYRK
jgi:hypothetical protein